MKILMADVGGSNVKLMVSGSSEIRRVPSGSGFIASKMIKETLAATHDWKYDAISVGFPGHVSRGLPCSEPLNLGDGWVDYDYMTAFGKPVRFINDAALQALAAYREGRMLFIGLGTSTGATLIVDDVIIPLEIGGLRLARTLRFMDRLGKAGYKKAGRQAWLKSVFEAVEILRDLFHPNDIVIGGGNAKKIEVLPVGCRKGGNHTSFPGAERLWPGADLIAVPETTTWRILRNRNLK